MGDKWGVTAYEVSCWGQSLPTEAYRHSKINVVMARGLKRTRESKMGASSSARIIEDVDLALKALERVYRANGAAFEGVADRNGHRRKVVQSTHVNKYILTYTFPVRSTETPYIYSI